MAEKGAHKLPAVYRKLPPSMKEVCRQELGMEKLKESPDRFVTSFLQTRLSQRDLSRGAVEKLGVQMMWLDAPGKPQKVVNLSKQPRKKLSSRQKKAMKLYEIPKEQQKYSLYTALHDLWRQYMEDLLQLGAQKGKIGQAQMNLKVVKADLHGCLLTVLKSKCPSYVGTQGIVLQELQNVFRLICRDNKLRTVPKANSVFTFDLGGYQFCLYGNHLRYRAGERSARKFKDKPTIDL